MGDEKIKLEFEKLLNHPDPYHIPIKELKQLKLKAFKQAITYHFENCPEYREYCKLHNVKPSDIKTYEDLTKIQPIPSDIFRDAKKLVLSIPESEIVKVFTTSGTSGTPSRYPFDMENMKRMAPGVAKGFLQVGGVKGGTIIMLTPSPKESDTGMVQGFHHAMKFLGYPDEKIIYTVRKGKFDPEYVIEVIEKSEKPQHLFGPPFAFVELVNYLKAKKMTLELDKKSRLLTSGGWKKVKGEISRNEFEDLLSEAFGVEKNQFRDTYGLTDVMSGMVECEYHKKHVPPWIHVSVRDPANTDKEVPNNKVGLITFSSCLIYSYPAFSMPGDMAVAEEGTCKCGRIGQIVEHKGRISKLGARGCALRLEQFMDIITKEK